MSAIHDRPAGYLVGPVGEYRFHTTCKVVVHSHVSAEPIILSQEVISISTNKSTKDMGTAALSLRSSRNWLNIIYPNDYINIYFDLDDGRGLTRTFFGLIDRIEEDFSVSETGSPSTFFNVTCSDFQKILEKTNIYFNPALNRRPDFLGEFGTPNIGGLALMTSGVEASGSPPDIILNLLLVMLGFGTQFVLPESYNPAPSYESRTALLEYIESGLSESSKQKIFDAGGFEAFLQREREAALSIAIDDSFANPSLRENQAVPTIDDIRHRTTEVLGKRLATELEQDPTNSSGFGPGIVKAIPGASSRPPSLLDIIDMFSFVEKDAMDGWLRGAPVWGSLKDATLMSGLRSFSNEIVNELMFDLRPKSAVKDGATEYSTRPDEIEGNVQEGKVTGVEYVPAVVMREYPFGTIREYNGNEVSINLPDTAKAVNVSQNLPSREQATLGTVPIGAVFSDRPNAPGRHLIPFPTINPKSKILGTSTGATNRVLDVAVISEKEIKSTKFGRSDHDHFNLLEVLCSTALLGKELRFFMMDLSPLINPIHIKRNGLRVRSLATRFAAFDLTTAATSSPLPTKTGSEDEESADLTFSDTFVAPIQGASGGTRSTLSQYGYRLSTSGGDQVYKFHNGIDIYADIGTPVYAVADGYLVCSAPPGCKGFSYYSTTIIIKHPGMGPAGEDIFSLYSHLDSRTVPAQPKIRKKLLCVSDSLCKGGKLAEVPIKAGEQIGTVGNQAGTFSNPTRTFSTSLPHLHFELLVKSEGIVYPAIQGFLTQDKIDSITNNGYTVVDPEKGVHGAGGSTPTILKPPASSIPIGAFPLDGTNPRTIDPVSFFMSKGVDLLAEANNASPSATPHEEGVDSGEGSKSEETEDTQVPENVDAELAVATGRNPQLRENIDDIPIRKQLGRWLILQDHWYQHNAEYLSGQIHMRGAPEIRAGYRLDILERNLSFYVESVNHTWTYPKNMLTTLQVTRGQSNNPHPLYIPPSPQKSQKQTGNSRLAKFFLSPDPIAVRRSLVLGSDGVKDYNQNPFADIEDPTPEEVAIPAVTESTAIDSEVEDDVFDYDKLIQDITGSSLLDITPGDVSSVGGNDTTSSLPRK